MKFFNPTHFSAKLLRSHESDERMMAALIARASFRVERGRLVPTGEDLWPVGPAPPETPFGEVLGDTPFLKGGVDVIVVGNAYPPTHRPERALRLEISAGRWFRRSLAVFGDRRWMRTFGGFSISEPERFTSMPLTYENAFGGKTKWEDGTELAWPANPAGKGFYLDDASAEGQPLPNLEDPDALLGSPSDRPEAVGTAPYPITNSLRAERAAVLNLEPGKEGIRKLKPILFNHAHPRMVIPPKDAPKPGELFEVTCVRPMGGVKFEMPDLRLHAEVRLADRAYQFPLHVDHIAVLGEQARVVLGLRTVFRYRTVDRERRTTTLVDAGAPGQSAS